MKREINERKREGEKKKRQLNLKKKSIYIFMVQHSSWLCSLRNPSILISFIFSWTIYSYPVLNNYFSSMSPTWKWILHWPYKSINHNKQIAVKNRRHTVTAKRYFFFTKTWSWLHRIQIFLKKTDSKWCTKICKKNQFFKILIIRAHFFIPNFFHFH